MAYYHRKVPLSRFEQFELSRDVQTSTVSKRPTSKKSCNEFGAGIAAQFGLVKKDSFSNGSKVVKRRKRFSQDEGKKIPRQSISNTSISTDVVKKLKQSKSSDNKESDDNNREKNGNDDVGSTSDSMEDQISIYERSKCMKAYRKRSVANYESNEKNDRNKLIGQGNNDNSFQKNKCKVVHEESRTVNGSGLNIQTKLSTRLKKSGKTKEKIRNSIMKGNDGIQSKFCNMRKSTFYMADESVLGIKTEAFESICSARKDKLEDKSLTFHSSENSVNSNVKTMKNDRSLLDLKIKTEPSIEFLEHKPMLDTTSERKKGTSCQQARIINLGNDICFIGKTEVVCDCKGIDLTKWFSLILDRVEQKSTKTDNAVLNYFITLHSRFKVMETMEMSDLEVLPEEDSDKTTETQPIRIFTILNRDHYEQFLDSGCLNNIPELIITKLNPKTTY